MTFLGSLLMPREILLKHNNGFSPPIHFLTLDRWHGLCDGKFVKSNTQLVQLYSSPFGKGLSIRIKASLSSLHVSHKGATPPWGRPPRPNPATFGRWTFSKLGR